MLAIIVEDTHQTVAQEVHVDTVVLLEGCFPRHVRVVLCGLDSTLGNCSVLNTEVVGIGVGILTDTLSQSGGIHIVRIGNIHESASTNLIVTDKTPRSTELHEAEHFLQRLEESLVADYPSNRTCGECTEALTGSEVLGTIVTDIEFSDIAVVPVVGYTAYKTNVRTRNIRIGTADIVFLTLVVKCKGRNGVLSECTAVVQRTFQIPVSAGT